jgi:hypothetical protein
MGKGVEGGHGRREAAGIGCLAVGLALLAACGSSPPAGPPPLTPYPSLTPSVTGTDKPTQPPGFNKNGTVKVPETIKLNFFYPTPITSPTEHTVLLTVQEGINAELRAIYVSNPADPPLLRYWTGRAYQAAAGEVRKWVSIGEQPVGQMIVDKVALESIAPPEARIGYCVDETNVLRGKKVSNVVGPAVQAKDQPGTWETLWLRQLPAPGSGWVITRVLDAFEAPRCPAPDSKPGH